MARGPFTNMSFTSFALAAISLVFAFVAGAIDGRAWSALLMASAGIIACIAILVAGSEAYHDGLKDGSDIDRE